MISEICMGLALLGTLIFLWRETKSWFKFLDRMKTPVYQEGEEEDHDS